MSIDAPTSKSQEPIVLSGLDGLRERAGTTLGVSDWVDVTQDNVTTFAELTGDEQWIHVDPVRAKAGPYGTTIQHGFLTLGMSTGLLWSVCTVSGFDVSLNYGLNKVRFPAPLVPAVTREPQHEMNPCGRPGVARSATCAVADYVAFSLKYGRRICGPSQCERRRAPWRIY
jgi:hypothetical protein